ncbi:hypothetical protein VTH06DRAFT_7623 [Thermothelomyces fergusii]
MVRRSRKPPPQIYHDGLIPATEDTYESYPEVVPDDYNQVKHEKSYPELAPPPDADPEQQQQLQQQQQQRASDDHVHHHHHHHHHHEQQEDDHSYQQAQLAGSGAAAVPALPPLPRTSGEHSLRQAWSELGESKDGRSGGDGAESKDGDGDGDGDGSRGGGSASSTPSVRNPTCPGADSHNYTSTAAAMPKTFRIQCGANYPRGDGELGRLGDPVNDLAGCLDACAKNDRCVGAVFSPESASGSCWLKEFLGVVDRDGEARGMVSGLLWQ